MTDLYKDIPVQFPSFALPQLTVTADDIATELGHLEGRKAVPQHIAPSFLWKELAHPLLLLASGWTTSR